MIIKGVEPMPLSVAAATYGPPSMYGNHIRAVNHWFAALKVPI
jgi:hypothetical protein